VTPGANDQTWYFVRADLERESPCAEDAECAPFQCWDANRLCVSHCFDDRACAVEGDLHSSANVRADGPPGGAASTTNLGS
jgi:hypothetical protein